MSNYLSKLTSETIVAALGFNDGANKGFWRIQPRDRIKRWVEMGAELRAAMKVNGKVLSVVGNSVGSTGTPDEIRVLFKGLEDQGIPDGIYAVPSRFVEVVSAVLPAEFLAKKGIKRPENVKPLGADGQVPDIADLERADITPDDIRIANEGIDSPEGQEQTKFKDSEEGKAVAEKDAAEGEEAAPKAPKAAKTKKIVTASKSWMENAEEGSEFFYKKPGSDKLIQAHIRDDGYAYAGPYIESEQDEEGVGLGSPEELFDWSGSGRGPGAFYKGRVPLKDGGPFNIEAPELREMLADQKAKSPIAKPAAEEAPAAPEGVERAGVKMPKVEPESFEDQVQKLSDEKFDILEKMNALDSSDPKDAPELERLSAEYDKADAKYTDLVGDSFDTPESSGEDLSEPTSKLWNDSVYGDGADLDAVINDAKITKAAAPFGIKPRASQEGYALDVKEGDFFYDPETEELLKATGEPDWNADRSAINIPAVDATGADRSVNYSNDKKSLRKVVDYTQAKEAPAEPEAETPEADATSMPDTVVSMPTSDIREGDDLYTGNGVYLGKVDSATPVQDVSQKSNDIRLKYTDETGKSYNVPYSRDSKFNVVRTEEEAPVAEIPSAPEAPVTPKPVKPVKPVPTSDAEPQEGDVREGIQQLGGPKGPDMVYKNGQWTPVKRALVLPATPTPTPAQTPASSVRTPDDGQPIAQPNFTGAQVAAFRKEKLAGLIDENGDAVIEFDKKGKAYNPKDPNALMNFLASKFTDSKFMDDGKLVLMREIAEEDGMSLQWEIRAANSGQKKIIYTIALKNLDTGEEIEYLHKDARDSIQSLFGKTNSPDTLANILTGVETRKTGNYDSVDANNIYERAHYFGLQGKTKTVAEVATHYASGVAERLNSKNLTVLESKVDSVWDAYFTSATTEEEMLARNAAIRDRLKAVFGRIPLDEVSHAKARTALRAEFARRYPGENKAPMSGHITTASMDVRGQKYAPATPYSSKDRVRPIDEGMTVEYTNNVGDKSTLKVVRRQKVNTANPKQSEDIFDYGDYVTVADANGVTSSLPTTSLLILKDQDSPLTEYKGRVSGGELFTARGGVATDPTTLEFPEPGQFVDEGGVVDDLTPGGNFFGKNGDLLGQVVEIQPIIGKNGKPGYAVLFIDKNGDLKKAGVAAGEVRGPKK